MKISVIMPVKDAQLYLRASIESILSQSYDNLELIIVNDHSRDRTMEILNSYQHNPRVHVFLNNGRGIVPALAQAFNFSRGDFIHRMDGDDIMPPTKLENLYKYLASHPPKTVVSGKIKYFSDSPLSEGYERYQAWINSFADGRSYLSQIYRECVVSSANWLVARRCFEEDIDIHSLKYPEDYDLVLRWYRLGYKIEYLKEVTHYWRLHENNTSKKSNHYSQKSFFRLKTEAFINNELADNEPVQVIGAARKGKLVSTHLQALGIPFEWFHAGPSRELSGQRLISVENLSSNRKTILTSWPLDQLKQRQITTFLGQKGLTMGENCWIF